jgi:hypothetical protein
MRNERRMGVCLQVVLAIVAAAQVGLAQSQLPAIRRGEVGFRIESDVLQRSPAIRAPIEQAEPFLAVGVVWSADAREGGHVRISLRGSAEGRTWSEWRVVSHDHDSGGAPGRFVGALSLFDRQTHFIQYQLEAEPGHHPGVTGLRLVFISPGSASSWY